MTEEEWRTTRDPVATLEHLHAAGHTSKRKLNLFAVACCRLNEHLFYDPCEQAAVKALERYADGACGVDELITASVSVRDIDIFDPDNLLPRTDSSELDARGAAAQLVWLATSHDAPEGGVRSLVDRTHAVITGVLSVAYHLDMLLPGPYQTYQDLGRLCTLLRCIFDNPFRPVAFDPRWRTETAIALATGIYEERAFDRLPILADALEEAGCDHADVLNHCRGSGPHARGCWVVDLVLGKE